MKLILKLLAPYFAVGIFWCVFSNAWLAILAYHLQILFWSRHSIAGVRKPKHPYMMLLALPTALAGPVCYFLLPHIVHTDLASWLIDHHLSRNSLMIMLPFFGLLHPLLEQLRWAPLRESTPLSHLLFAGYHMLVLHSLLTIPWLIVCFFLLAMASFVWQQMTKKYDNLTLPVASHVLADLGVIIAAWLIV